MKDQDDIQKLFLNTKPVELLIQLSKPNARHYSSALSKDVGVTYSHTVKCVQEFKSMELVNFEKKGRKKIINLNDTGQELANKFQRLRKACQHDVPEEDSSGSGFGID